MLSVVLLYLEHRPLYISKHNVPEVGFCLRLQVEPTQLGSIDRASSYLRPENEQCEDLDRNNIIWRCGPYLSEVPPLGCLSNGICHLCTGGSEQHHLVGSDVHHVEESLHTHGSITL